MLFINVMLLWLYWLTVPADNTGVKIQPILESCSYIIVSYWESRMKILIHVPYCNEHANACKSHVYNTKTCTTYSSATCMQEYKYVHYKMPSYMWLIYALQYVRTTIFYTVILKDFTCFWSKFVTFHLLFPSVFSSFFS